MLRTLTLVSAFMLLATGCSEKSSEQIADHSAEVPDEIITDFNTAETDSGRVAWTLTAPKAYKYNSRKVYLMDKPRIEFFDGFGNLQTTMTSDNGEYFETSRDMLAYGNVVVVSVEGDVLETDSLRYVPVDDQIVSDSRVRLTRGKNLMTGIGLRCDHNLNSVEILKDVEATIIEEDQLNG
jgi:LPS export ABC transporter protein LptC